MYIYIYINHPCGPVESSLAFRPCELGIFRSKFVPSENSDSKGVVFEGFEFPHHKKIPGRICPGLDFLSVGFCFFGHVGRRCTAKCKLHAKTQNGTFINKKQQIYVIYVHITSIYILVLGRDVLCITVQQQPQNS